MKFNRCTLVYTVRGCQCSFWYSCEVTRVATAAVNNFINRAWASINRTKTHKQHGKALFVVSVSRTLLSSEGRISGLSVTGIEMIKHCAITDGQLCCLFDSKWRTPWPWTFISSQGSVSAWNNEYLCVMTLKAFIPLMQRHTLSLLKF